MFGFTHSPVEWVYGINVYVLVCLSLRVCVCDRVYVWVLLMIHIILPTETDSFKENKARKCIRKQTQIYIPHQNKMDT